MGLVRQYGDLNTGIYISLSFRPHPYCFVTSKDIQLRYLVVISTKNPIEFTFLTREQKEVQKPDFLNSITKKTFLKTLDEANTSYLQSVKDVYGIDLKEVSIEDTNLSDKTMDTSIRIKRVGD